MQFKKKFLQKIEKQFAKLFWCKTTCYISKIQTSVISNAYFVKKNALERDLIQ